jgi:hypothetical protein
MSAVAGTTKLRSVQLNNHKNAKNEMAEQQMPRPKIGVRHARRIIRKISRARILWMAPTCFMPLVTQRSLAASVNTMIKTVNHAPSNALSPRKNVVCDLLRLNKRSLFYLDILDLDILYLDLVQSVSQSSMQTFQALFRIVLI